MNRSELDNQINNDNNERAHSEGTDRAGVREVAQTAKYAPCTDVIHIINVLQSIKKKGFQPELEDR